MLYISMSFAYDAILFIILFLFVFNPEDEAYYILSTINKSIIDKI